MKFYDPPAALLPKGDKYTVELAGAKCFVAIDERKNLYNIGMIFAELSQGEYWRGQENISIQDQIEKINILAEDADALYDSNVLAERIIETLDRIRKRELLFLGIASFEGNAFESAVFNEMELNNEDQDRLMNLYKVSRKSGYPDLKKEIKGGRSFSEINFFGDASTFFTFPNRKNIKEIASILFPYQGNASGIVAVAQGAANFILLTDNIFKSIEEQNIHIDRKNLEEMFRLINLGVLEAPISWFKIDLGLTGLHALDKWDEIKDREDVMQAISSYQDYMRNLIVKFRPPQMEKIIDMDLGKTISDISRMSQEEIENDLEQVMGAINRLSEYDEENRAESLLTDPPRILFAYGDKKKVAIGGALALLSVDVGANICCIVDLREDISWGEYFLEDESKFIDEETFYDIEEDSQFLELENPVDLRDTYIHAFQTIMQGSEVFLGLLELESNGFKFSLFQELDLPEQDLEKIQAHYQHKIKNGKFPKLRNRRIKVNWYGKGKQIFNFEGIFRSVLDIAQEIKNNPDYHDRYAAGIVATSQKSAHFYILSSNFQNSSHGIDFDTLNRLFMDLKNSTLAPLCWFKISLGESTLKQHPFWKGAFQYDTLQIVLSKYESYIDELIRIKKSENQYRIY